MTEQEVVFKKNRLRNMRENGNERLHRLLGSGLIKQALVTSYGKYNLWFVFGGLILISSISTPNFLTTTNVFNILRQSSIIGCLAVGQNLVILTGGIDLSVGSIVALSSVLSAIYQGFGVIPAALVGLAGGTAVGATSGLFVTKGRVPPFIATLATMGIARGIALTVTHGWVVKGVTKQFEFMGSGHLGPFPFPLIIFFALALAVVAFLATTKEGRCIFAVGGSESATRLSGINITKTKLLAYCLSGFCAGIGGVIYTARLTVGQPTAGVGFELDSIAAVIIGGTNLFGGEGSVVGTVVGVLILQMVTNLMNLLGVSPYIQEGVKGVILLGAVFASIRGQRV
jgi:ribose/xylose/arabinose/galactoside ABC-type transport system permease subunit